MVLSNSAMDLNMVYLAEAKPPSVPSQTSLNLRGKLHSQQHHKAGHKGAHQKGGALFLVIQSELNYITIQFYMMKNIFEIIY